MENKYIEKYFRKLENCKDASQIKQVLKKIYEDGYEHGAISQQF